MSGLGAAGLAAGRSFFGRGRSGAASEVVLYVGTYTHGKSEGIYVCRMDARSGMVRLDRVVKGVVNPSFLAIDRGRKHLYAVNETAEYEGKPGGAVSAFAINPQTGDLQFLNRQASHGGAPCHLVVDKTSRFVLAANYSGGNAVVLPIQKDGSLGKATEVVQHFGSGPNTRRQEAPHAHSVTLDAANRFAYVADLGIDRVMVYRFNGEKGKLEPGTPPFAQMAPGAGPRHFAFHPHAERAYVINELDCTLTAFRYDHSTGALTETQTISTLPAGFAGENTCADVHVHAAGRFVYGSNRGHDSIVVYSVDEETGRLSLVQHEPTQGKTPRNFAVDPTGRFLLAANQNSDSVVIFAIDPETGRLTATGHVVEVPVPVCLRFAEPHA